MKQSLYVSILIILSIFVGTFFMKISKEKEIIPTISDINTAKIFQVGIYTNENDALKEASIKKGIVIKEDENYVVYVAILRNSGNIERMINYLTENNIYYILKDITIDSEFLDTIIKYEELMDNATSDVAFIQLNKKILERYEFIYES